MKERGRGCLRDGEGAFAHLFFNERSAYFGHAQEGFHRRDEATDRSPQVLLAAVPKPVNSAKP